ncbi:RNase adaptor protein RapZ [Snodgrassella alvi]|jgi:RNase adapter protein RapZ|uniref:RNase adaptor protein RapZ n=1 Tax=Snodgrassella alvi TaxID=1196083 RepID=A0A2N9XYV7_9NEIS|nr:RNase adapter RapZ [Snodgrassella alvi]PIT52237.1 RNase adaptor protein RapZ [Snodgrassella alvi]PIT56106.1 RNase adaptor protein RapZ [Snodgrassella alvi]
MRIVLISGLSGSGKSIALRLLEDVGFVCVDNLPVKLLPDLIEHYAASDVAQLGVSVDIRSRFNPVEVLELVTRLRAQEHQVDLLFLTSSAAVLLRRFSETRRSHPLAQEHKTLSESVAAEQQYMSALQRYAYVIDTSLLNVPQLRRQIQQWLHLPVAPMRVVLESFGYKYGVPAGLDFVFDVRFLPNPYYDFHLRPFSGLDEPIRAFFSQQPVMAEMIAELADFLLRWLPMMEKESRSYVNIGIGCTGGQHRSVYIVEALAQQLNAYCVLVRHRQLELSNSSEKTV